MLAPGALSRYNRGRDMSCKLRSRPTPTDKTPDLRRRVALIGLILIMGLWACDREDKAPPSAPPPAPAPPPETHEGFAGITADRLRARARSFEHGALVNVWASWCGSCKKELPMLTQIVEAYSEHGLGLVTVTADQPESLRKARELLESAAVKGEHYYLSGRVSVFKRTLDPRWKGAVPATFLVDGTGKVRYFWNGPVLADEIREVVQGYLAGDPIDGMTDFTVGQ